MNQGPFDYVPAGKKPIIKDGKWELVPLEAENKEDLQVLLEECRQQVKQLEAKIAEQAIELDKFHKMAKKEKTK